MTGWRQNTANPLMGDLRPLLRLRLLERLEALPAGSLVLMVAGPGHGKTTLVEQWARWSSHVVRVVRVAVDDDSQPRFGGDLVAAFIDVQPSARALLCSALERGPSATESLATAMLDVLGNAPFTLVIDDADLVRSPESSTLLRSLARKWPATSSLVLTGRQRPGVGFVRERFDSPVHLVSEGDLEFDEAELTELLLRHRVEATRVPEILEWTGGWPAGVRLTLTNPSFRREDVSGPRAAERVRGVVGKSRGWVQKDERDLLAILGLSELSPGEIEFLEVLAVLTPTTAEIVDAVLHRNDTLSILQAIHRRGVALVGLSAETPAGIVIHTLLASALRTRLEREDPQRVIELRRRVADVLVATGRIDQAVALLEELGDVDLVVDVLYRNMTILLDTRQLNRLVALVRGVPLDEVPCGAALTIVAAHTVDQRDEALFRAMAERVVSDTTTILPDGRTPARIVSRAITGFGFAPVDRSDLDPANPDWTLARLAAEATEDYMSDRVDEAIQKLGAMATITPRSAYVEATRLGLLAIAKAETGRPHEAATHVENADQILLAAKLTDSSLTAIVDVAAVVVARRRGGGEIEERLSTARVKMSTSGDGKKLWHARGLLELASVSLELGDPPGLASAAIEDVKMLVRPWRGLHRVERLVRELSRGISEAQLQRRPRRAALTAAEQRVLTYLPSHYSIPRIAAELRIGQSTAKTQCLAVYRKLGVNDRADAVRKAQSLGLLAVDMRSTAPHPIVSD